MLDLMNQPSVQVSRTETASPLLVPGRILTATQSSRAVGIYYAKFRDMVDQNLVPDGIVAGRRTFYRSDDLILWLNEGKPGTVRFREIAAQHNQQVTAFAQ